MTELSILQLHAGTLQGGTLRMDQRRSTSARLKVWISDTAKRRRPRVANKLCRSDSQAGSLVPLSSHVFVTLCIIHAYCANLLLDLLRNSNARDLQDSLTSGNTPSMYYIWETGVEFRINAKL